MKKDENILVSGLGTAGFDLFFAILAGSAAVFGYKYLKLRKKHELVFTVLYGLGALANLVGWILQLSVG